MDQETDVTSDSSTDTGSQPAAANEETVETPQPQKPPKGFVPYQALEEERSKRKELEEQLANISTPSEEPEFVSDEGKELRKEIQSLNERIRSNERKEARRETETAFPVLRERKEEFDSFLEDEENKRLSIQKAAKLFLAENNLLAQEPPKRESLEKPTSGGNKAPEPTITPDEVERLRKEQPRKYEELLQAGKFDDIPW